MTLKSYLLITWSGCSGVEYYWSFSKMADEVLEVAGQRAHMAPCGHLLRATQTHENKMHYKSR